jgi:hypothetical protein
MQSFPDIEAMDTARFEHWLSKTALDEPHRQELRAVDPSERNVLYPKLIFWYQLRDARNACNEFRKCLDYNSIFVRPEIKKVFVEIDDLLYDALISRQTSERANDHTYWTKASATVQEHVRPRMEKIEGTVVELLRKEGLD